MNENGIPAPVVSVDLKRYLIRIHRSTLHLIGDPDNVLLLVNPDEHTLAILSSDDSDPRSHHISKAYIAKQKSFELYSRLLVKSLFDICDNWHENQSYRLYGEIISKEGAVQFHMDKSVLMKRTKV